jgi:ribose 5-phosphate isomerase B
MSGAVRRLLIGGDHAAFEMKKEIVAFLQSLRIEVEDVGSHSADRVRLC